MATAPKILADGQLANTATAIFTVSAGEQAIVRLISLSHVAGGIQTVILYVKKFGGTARVLSRATLDVNEFAHEDEIETLDAGDSIMAETTDAASIDFTVLGVRITA